MRTQLGLCAADACERSAAWDTRGSRWSGVLDTQGTEVLLATPTFAGGGKLAIPLALNLLVVSDE